MIKRIQEHVINILSSKVCGEDMGMYVHTGLLSLCRDDEYLKDIRKFRLKNGNSLLNDLGISIKKRMETQYGSKNCIGVNHVLYSMMYMISDKLRNPDVTLAMLRNCIANFINPTIITLDRKIMKAYSNILGYFDLVLSYNSETPTSLAVDSIILYVLHSLKHSDCYLDNDVFEQNRINIIVSISEQYLSFFMVSMVLKTKLL